MTDYNLSQTQSNWCSEILGIMSMLNMDDKFTNLQCCDIDMCSKIILIKAEKEWQKNLSSKPKLRSYVKFKDSLSTSHYVSKIHNRYTRSMIAKLRSGILQLHVETGRYNQTKIEDRTCNLCNSGEVEDEFHFICKCELYNDTRSQLYNDICKIDETFRLLNDENKFVRLLSNYSHMIGKFMKVAWEKRRLKLYN